MTRKGDGHVAQMLATKEVTWESEVQTRDEHKHQHP